MRGTAFVVNGPGGDSRSEFSSPHCHGLPVWTSLPTQPFSIHPDRKEKNRASVISNSKPTVPEAPVTKGPDRRAGGWEHRWHWHTAACTWRCATGVTTWPENGVVPSLLPSDRKTPPQYSWLRWFTVCSLVLHWTEPAGVQGSWGQAVMEGASARRQREACVTAKAKGQIFY